jgi:hypothetical protein
MRSQSMYHPLAGSNPASLLDGSIAVEPSCSTHYCCASLAPCSSQRRWNHQVVIFHANSHKAFDMPRTANARSRWMQSGDSTRRSQQNEAYSNHCRPCMMGKDGNSHRLILIPTEIFNACRMESHARVSE